MHLSGATSLQPAVTTPSKGITSPPAVKAKIQKGEKSDTNPAMFSQDELSFTYKFSISPLSHSSRNEIPKIVVAQM